VENFSKQKLSQFKLYGNYPNPFNTTTTIRFGLSKQSTIILTIYNILGQKVFEISEENLPAGNHTFNFNASNLISGIYIYKISVVGVDRKNIVASKKMMLLK